MAKPGIRQDPPGRLDRFVWAVRCRSECRASTDDRIRRPSDRSSTCADDCPGNPAADLILHCSIPNRYSGVVARSSGRRHALPRNDARGGARTLVQVRQIGKSCGSSDHPLNPARSPGGLSARCCLKDLPLARIHVIRLRPVLSGTASAR